MVEDRHPTRRALGLPDVRYFLTARFFGVTARTLFATAISWHLWDLTGREIYLGVLGLVEFLPVIPVTLLGGAVADVRDRRSVVLGARAAALACAAGLAIGSGATPHELWLLLGVAFTLAVAGGFENPAGVALLPALSAGTGAILGGFPLRAGAARAALQGAGASLALAGALLLVVPQLRIVLTRPIAPLRDVGEYLRARAGDDPLSVLRAGYGLGGGMPKIYDPWIQYIHTRAEVEALCRRATRDNLPLYVFYGQEGMNRRRGPDGWALLDDPALFEEEARFSGIEARFLYRVLRYTGAPLPAPDPREDARLPERTRGDASP